MRSLLLALTLAALLPASAGAAAGNNCDTRGSHHVYSLKTFRGATCGAARHVSRHLATRFDRPADFRDGNSRNAIAQKDGGGHAWSCKWQSGSSKGDIALWSCSRGKRLITWIWRYEQI
jgi:hypothetical protein